VLGGLLAEQPTNAIVIVVRTNAPLKNLFVIVMKFPRRAVTATRC
jgi:hypothetical protein